MVLSGGARTPAAGTKKKKKTGLKSRVGSLEGGGGGGVRRVGVKIEQEEWRSGSAAEWKQRAAGLTALVPLAAPSRRNTLSELIHTYTITDYGCDPLTIPPRRRVWASSPRQPWHRCVCLPGSRGLESVPGGARWWWRWTCTTGLCRFWQVRFTH